MSRYKTIVKGIKENPLIDYIKKGASDLANGVPSRQADALQKHFPRLVRDEAIVKRMATAAPHLKPVMTFLLPASRRSNPVARKNKSAGHLVTEWLRVSLKDIFSRNMTDGEWGSDEIFLAWSAMVNGVDLRTGTTKPTDDLDDGETHVLRPAAGDSLTFYVGPASHLRFEIAMWEQDNGNIAAKLREWSDQVAALWEEYVIPALEVEPSAWACINTLGAALGLVEADDEQAQQCLAALGTVFDEAVAFIADFMGLDDDAVATRNGVIDLANYADMTLGQHREYAIDFRGDGGRFEVTLDISRVPCQKRVLSDRGLAPSITAGSAGSRVAMLWRGNDRHLNVASYSGYQQRGKVVLDQWSHDPGPVLLQAHKDGAPADMVMVWEPPTGLSFCRSPDGKVFGPSTEIDPFGATRDASIAIAEDAGKGHIYVAWPGKYSPSGSGHQVAGHNINVLRTGDIGRTWDEKVTLGDSARGIAMAFYQDQLIMAWTGTDSRGHINVAIYDNGRLKSKRILDDWSQARPALAVHEGRLYLAWTGGDKRINLMYADGSLNFGNRFVLSETSRLHLGPALASVAGNLMLAWTGTDSRAHLNLLAVD